jgi:hypothetical protein
MARKSMFPLKMADDVQVRKLEELQEHFDFQAVYSYYDDGRLLEWLEARYYENEAEKVKALDKNAPDFKKSLCEIFGVDYQDDLADSVDLENISERNERLEKLRTFTSDDKILAAVDRVAFDQEELADLLNDDVKVIYLCGDSFRIPGSKEGVTYIGVNNPKVEVPDGFRDKNIIFENVDSGDVALNIEDVIKQAKETGDLAKKAKLWRIAAEAGNAEAWFELAECYYNGDGIEENDAEAVKWYQKAAEQGNSEAQYILGECYNFGNGVEQNGELAIKWFRMASEQGDAEATFQIGDCYNSGFVVEQNSEIAMKWYRKAAEQGSTNAKAKLHFLGNSANNASYALKNTCDTCGTGLKGSIWKGLHCPSCGRSYADAPGYCAM